MFLLNSPPAALPLRASLRVYEQSRVGRVKLQLDGETLLDMAVKPGPVELVTAPVKPAHESATVTLTVDHTFTVGGDQRDLGVILTGVGFR